MSRLPHTTTHFEYSVNKYLDQLLHLFLRDCAKIRGEILTHVPLFKKIKQTSENNITVLEPKRPHDTVYTQYGDFFKTFRLLQQHILQFMTFFHEKIVLFYLIRQSFQCVHVT